ncbi:NAD(P)/FAD-dependent oxidoreductase [Trichloromonas sp.]|uniref:NAD(P)/FAD-dependent oxidoreductase n=1 Tax=Trichloromonas sp. TaxID=3069249 RepID=UPI003D8146DF
MRIAVIGGGISGLAAAHLLSDEHEVTLFEANDYLGGHTNTVDVTLGDSCWAVDTGFIVFNERTYPNFIRLLDRLGVASQPSVMSFSVSNQRTGLEYCATNLDTLFAQRRNLLSFPFWRMLWEIFRFNRQSRELYASDDLELTLGTYLAAQGYSERFIDDFLVPMGSAIWSADPTRFLQFPAAAFVRFFTNHGILNVVDQPQWRVVRGGSRNYVATLARPFKDRVRLASPIARVRRHADRVELQGQGGPAEDFDQVILACHSDQALAMLEDPSERERELLGAIPYQKNNTVLHTDSRLLPSLQKARASWNCCIPRRERGEVSLTYWMNTLQSLQAPVDVCVTLNDPETIAPEQIQQRLVYHHPVYSPAAFAAQKRNDEISGSNRTWYCGAWWGYGFHEDGLNSALEICRHFGKTL